MGFKIVMQDNSADIIELVKKNKERALEAVGAQAEGDVKDEITDVGAVDTGRLRSSIAHQVDGDSVEVGTKRMVHPQKPRRYIKNAMIRYAEDYMSILAEYLFKRD